MSFGTPPAIEYIQGRSDSDQPFIPIVGTLAAAINQVPPQQFLSDATQLANGLQRAQRLFELDAVCVVPDPTLIAEAFGATVEWDETLGRFVTTDHVDSIGLIADPNRVPDEGRVPIAVDAAERLITSTDEDVAVFGVVPGPQTTAEALLTNPADEDWTGVIRTAIGEVARAFGRAGVDAFLVAESPPFDDAEGGGNTVDTTVETLDVLDNIGEFFSTSLAFAPAGYTSSTIEEIVNEASIDAIFLDADDPDIDQEDIRVGCGITTSLLDADDDEVERTLQNRLADFPSTAFLASGVEVPSDVHPRKLQAAQRALEAVSY